MIQENEKIAQKSEVVRKNASALERFSVQATERVGSVASIVVHTVLFMGIFSLRAFSFSVEEILLILTTIVSLEAIYLAIFIQMTVNRQAAGLAEVQEDIEDIQEDVEEISEDIEGIQGEVEEISEDIENIQGEVKGLGEDVDGISEDLEEEDQKEEHEKRVTQEKLGQIETALQKLLEDIGELRKKG